jgi:predicted  nucleic acid-binding Zn-ribbon protein
MRILIALALVGCLLAACSSTPSASGSQKMCENRAQLSSAVSTFVNDLRSGSLSKAKDDLPAIRDALNSLSQSAQELKTQETQALSPQIDTLKNSVDNLKNATSFSDLQSGLSSIRSQAESLGSQIGDTLKCS